MWIQAENGGLSKGCNLRLWLLAVCEYANDFFDLLQLETTTFWLIADCEFVKHFFYLLQFETLISCNLWV